MVVKLQLAQAVPVLRAVVAVAVLVPVGLPVMVAAPVFARRQCVMGLVGLILIVDVDPVRPREEFAQVRCPSFNFYITF